jgi:hypothetical protein
MMDEPNWLAEVIYASVDYEPEVFAVAKLGDLDAIIARGPGSHVLSPISHLTLDPLAPRSSCAVRCGLLVLALEIVSEGIDQPLDLAQLSEVHILNTRYAGI